MKNKLTRNVYVVICTVLVFITFFVFFAFISPSMPYDADDWYYISRFPGSPIPIPHVRVWNPTRIFPEHLMPIIGYISAFVTYPLIGDYLFSFAVTTALLLGAFLSVLYISFYRLFLAFIEDKKTCALTGLFALALCFAIFRSRPSDNLHLFIVYSLNLHFFYTLPNILNSIVVCELIRLYLSKRLSFRSVPDRAPILVVLLYFCIFSMLFSAITLFAFVVSVLLYKLLDSLFHRSGKFPAKLKLIGIDGWKSYNIAIICVLGMLFAIVVELAGGRANWHSGVSYVGSVLSAGFFSQFFTAIGNVLSLFLRINIPVIVAFAMILFLSTGAFLFHRKKDKDIVSPFGKAIPVIFLSILFAFLFVALVSAKGGLQYTEDIRGTYSVFFFIILLVSLAVLYILKKIPFMRIFFPLMTVLAILVAVNARWPYAYPHSRTYTQTALTESFIEDVVNADQCGESEVLLKVPKYDADGNWPILIGSWENAFSNSLYKHKITSKKMNITIIPDESLPAT